LAARKNSLFVAEIDYLLAPVKAVGGNMVATMHFTSSFIG
jgi:hypothetical protein